MKYIMILLIASCAFAQDVAVKVDITVPSDMKAVATAWLAEKSLNCLSIAPAIEGQPGTGGECTKWKYADAQDLVQQVAQQAVLAHLKKMLVWAQQNAVASLPKNARDKLAASAQAKLDADAAVAAIEPK